MHILRSLKFIDLQCEPYSGLPHGQEKLKKNDKSQEKWGFLKKSQKI